MRAGRCPGRANATAIYPDEVLSHDRARYERRIGELFSTRFWGYMTGPEKQALAGVRIALPLRGATPVGAYALVDGGTPTLVLSTRSLRFVEDLSVDYDWRHLNECGLEPIDERVAMLKVRRPEHEGIG